MNFVCGFETGWGVLNNCTGQIANSIYADQPQDQGFLLLLLKLFSIILLLYRKSNIILSLLCHLFTKIHAAIFGLKNTIIAYNSLYRDRRGYWYAAPHCHLLPRLSCDKTYFPFLFCSPRTDIREGATTICGSPGLVDEVKRSLSS